MKWDMKIIIAVVVAISVYVLAVQEWRARKHKPVLVPTIEKTLLDWKNCKPLTYDTGVTCGITSDGTWYMIWYDCRGANGCITTTYGQVTKQEREWREWKEWREKVEEWKEGKRK